MYHPRDKAKGILDRAMEHIVSVDYSVSVRWVFYRLLQEGFYSKKEDYGLFIQLTSKARHEYYQDWHPEILSDDTRAMIPFMSGAYDEPEVDYDRLIEEVYQSEVQSRQNLTELLENYICTYNHEIDPYYYVDRYYIIMFEARAMIEQFRHYTKGVDLCPFGGQPSIPYKYHIAKHLQEESAHYGIPVIVLYFGDLDEGGERIFNAGREDITEWCDAEIEFIRCGLNEQQVKEYGIMENPERVGQYQWEALGDEQAREIIQGSLKDQGFDFEEITSKAKRKSEEITELIRAEVNEKLGE